jgi:Fe(3+) dicitrate transport protein
MLPSTTPLTRLSAGPIIAASALLFLALASHGRSQTVGQSNTELPEITITADADPEPQLIIPYLPPVEGTKIYAGKKATLLNLQALPEVQANNYNQAFALTPGLQIADSATPLVNLSYRGIGSPDKSQFLMLLQDGIPMAADPQGYPESYWTPPLESTQRIEFIRGGASLMYGPQPAGALNYVSPMPRTDRVFGMQTKNIFGSNNLYSTYNSFDGTSGKLGYYGYLNHRSGDGFRTANSDFDVTGGRLKLVYQQDKDTRWIGSFDAYSDRHGEAGGLSQADYAANRNQTVRPYDRFKLSRYAASVELQHKFSSRTEMSIKTWVSAVNRWSRRQTGGFGTVTAATNDLERQKFNTVGIEPRVRHDYELWGGNHSLAAGMQFYLCYSPRIDATGATPTDNTGTVITDAQRHVTYSSFFLENKFTFGRLTITPGFRMEMMSQSITVTNFGPNSQTHTRKVSHQPLFGIGIAYDLGNQTSIYANVSQSYRPIVFGATLIPAPGGKASDLAPGLTWTYELGMRGAPRPWFNWDSSFFLIDLDNQVGFENNTLDNVGRSINYGWDGAFQLDLIGALDAVNGTHRAERLGSLNFYSNLSLLKAQLSGPTNDGGKPQYAPPYILRTGLIYKRQSGLKIAFLGTFMGQQNGGDDGNPQYNIPSFSTWDLTAEVPVSKNFSVLAGLNNVFDRHYFTLVDSSGIQPANGRNFYVGGSLKF